MFRRRCLIVVLSGVFILSFTCQSVLADQMLSSGLHYSNGSYGDPVDTKMWYLPFSYRYRQARWQAQITVPYLKLSGPGNVVGARGDAVTVGNVNASASDKSAESGLGDTQLKAGYSLVQDYQSMWLLDVIGKIKIPTADEERGLGSGQTDVSAQLDLYKMLDRHTLFASTGYKVRGDGTIKRVFRTSSGDMETKQRLSLSDGWYTSLGYGWRAAKNWQAGVVWDWREPAGNDDADIQEIITYGQWRINSQWRLMIYLGAGLTANSSDASAGTQLSYRFD